jgi:hypothetical protein
MLVSIKSKVDGMQEKGVYIKFCKIIHNYNVPKLKFKELDETYKQIYEKKYHIKEDDVNKASFILFSLSFSIIFLISIFLTEFSIFMIILYSFIFSLICSYKFNTILLKAIKKDGAIINAHLYLLKIYHSLIQNSLKEDSDYVLNFIKLIKDYDIDISKIFKDLIRKIQEGKNPEGQLLNIITPSKDFNNYVKELIFSNFNLNEISKNDEKNTLERDFKIYLRQIDSKLSIIFFIGLFYPLGISFLMLFQRIDTLFTILLIPLFFLVLHFLFKKLIKVDNYLIGLINFYSKNERKKYNEFLLLLRGFALNLSQRFSPERAFINSYRKCKTQLLYLDKIIQNQVLRILNFTCSFEEMLDFLKIELKSIRYSLIIEILQRIIKQDAYSSSQKILRIIQILNEHRKLENKMELIINGEKFKVFLFIFLLPIVIGAIGGMFPFFILLIGNINLDNNSFFLLFNPFFIKDISFLFLSLLGCINLTSYYFLKVISYEKRFIIILIVNIVYSLVFFISYFNFINFF